MQGKDIRSEQLKKSRILLAVEIIGDLLSALVKIVLGIVGASAGMIAEGFHSITDCANEAFLLIGLELSRKPADRTHPFGYGQERFFWSLISALFISVVSGGFAIWQGVAKLISPEPISHFRLIFIALGIILVFQVLTLLFSTRRFQVSFRRTKAKSIVKGFRLIKKPSIINLWLNDVLSLGGTMLVLVSMGMVLITGSPIFDALSSIIIGLALIVLGLFLANDAKSLLIGEAVSPAMHSQIAAIMLSQKGVKKLLNLNTMLLTSEQVLINADVKFEDGLTTKQIEKVIDGIEAKIFRYIPSARYISIEVKA